MSQHVNYLPEPTERDFDMHEVEFEIPPEWQICQFKYQNDKNHK